MASGGYDWIGQLCPLSTDGEGVECREGWFCVGIAGVGSSSTGFCTPDCTIGGTTQCYADYEGKGFGGDPQCVLDIGNGASGCAIFCTQSAQCPTGLECVPVPGQSSKVCAPI